jgi:Fur family ferric uptake transcriptional regulator
VSFVERASEVIRAAGGRITEQRQLIIELLAQAHERIDAERLYQLAQQSDESINLATVYRTLNTLEEMGLIREQYISPGHERKYYTLAAETYHLTCRRCHKVIAFTSDVIETLRHQLETDLQVKTFNICMCVDGLCPDCQAEEQVQKRID